MVHLLPPPIWADGLVEGGVESDWREDHLLAVMVEILCHMGGREVNGCAPGQRDELRMGGRCRDGWRVIGCEAPVVGSVDWSGCGGAGGVWSERQALSEAEEYGETQVFFRCVCLGGFGCDGMCADSGQGQSFGVYSIIRAGRDSLL